MPRTSIFPTPGSRSFDRHARNVAVGIASIGRRWREFSAPPGDAVSGGEAAANVRSFEFQRRQPSPTGAFSIRFLWCEPSARET